MSSLNTSGEKTVLWAIEETPLPNSDASHLHHEQPKGMNPDKKARKMPNRSV